MRDLIIAIALFALLILALVAAFFALYRELWSASAFAERYVEEIADADASGALAMPGVAPEFTELEEIDRGYASETLLRSATLTSDIEDIHATEERVTSDGEDEIIEITVGYTLDGKPDEMVFSVERTGTAGLVPAWAFERSPLSVIDLTVRGSWQFSVNEFEIDKRQVSPEGLEAKALDPVSLLTFSPGTYDVAVDTAATVADPRSVRSAGSLETVEVDIQTEPTPELNEVVQDNIEKFLDEKCTTQAVLQPQGCPFGAPPDISASGIAQPDIAWEMVDYPTTALVPDGDDWRVSPTSGMVRLSLTLQNYYTGVLEPVERDVYFTMVASVEVSDDGGVHITIDQAGNLDG